MRTVNTGLERSMTRIAAVAGCLLLVMGGCATQPNADPWEGFNRSVHGFNEQADRYVLKPLAQGYRAVLPAPAERGIANVFSNLDDVQVSLNQLLQGKPGLAASDFGRFLVNSTIGLGGLFDVATSLGMSKHQEDFGQTFAVWGFGAGPYLVVPFWGPSGPRDGFGDIVGSYTFLPRYIDHVPTRNTVYAVSVINLRAGLLDVEDLVTGDRYTFFRDAYLQRREFLINDGVVEDTFLDD